ncbi:MAG: histidine phosphatase family protein [Gammaproteobacteria bacterium]|nr:histidine phosphatase family protein [Gammaproteobacteria bacterium]
MESHFTEIDFGDWESMTSQQILAQDAQRLSAYWQDPATTTPPNGEPRTT